MSTTRRRSIACAHKAEEIVKASPLWDGNLVKLQVTDADAQSMQLRVIASARSSGDAFDLRCEMREKLIAFLQRGTAASAAAPAPANVNAAGAGRAGARAAESWRHAHRQGR